MAQSVFINGRFLAQPLTGVQRYCRELVTSLDRLLQEEAGTRYSWTLLCPERANLDLSLGAIRPVAIGGPGGQVWEQGSLAYAARHGVLVSLGNSGPLCHPRQLVVIHDASIFRTPENYTWRYATARRILARLLAQTAHIGTVSHFSQRELADVLKLKPTSISIVPNGADHVVAHPSNPSILTELRLAESKYLLCVGSLSPNKNLARGVEAFQAIDDCAVKMVIVGGLATNVHKRKLPKLDERTIIAGRLSDAELITLYRGAAALVFPSIYEGFGIPPLEAMAQGCLVLASDIESIREVCGGAAAYFNPFNICEMTALFRQALTGVLSRNHFIEEGRRRASIYSWRTSAQTLRGIIDELCRT